MARGGMRSLLNLAASGRSEPESCSAPVEGIQEIDVRLTMNATEHSNWAQQGDAVPSSRHPVGSAGMPPAQQDNGGSLRGRLGSPPRLSVIQSLGSFGLDETERMSSVNHQRPWPAEEVPRSKGASKKIRNPPPPASGFATLAQQIMGENVAQKEAALLRLYAAVSQDARLMQADARSPQLDGFYQLLGVGLPRFIKNVAAVVLRTDKGTALMVRKMAAAILKALARWIEGSMLDADPLVSEALDAILLDGSSQANRSGRNSVDFTHSATDGYSNLLDTDALQGLFDGEASGSINDEGRSMGHVMDTQHMFGSLMESETLERLLSHNKPVSRSNLSSQLLTSHGSLEMTGHILGLKGALRAVLWLFKSDLPDARYTAASLVGSIAGKGIVQIDAMGGPRLIKPLIWLLRHGGAEHKLQACRALAELAKSDTCSHVISQRDKHLKLIAQVVRSQDLNTKLVAIKLANTLLSHEPGTHWIFSRCGMVAALMSQLTDPTSSQEMKGEAVNSLKHLTSASQTTREEVIKRGGVSNLSELLWEGTVDAQYNSARVLRHLAMSGDEVERQKVLASIPALVKGLRGRPRVSFACAAALAMIAEAMPAACEVIQQHGGIAALVQLLNHGGTQGKKVAAEALQALAAENELCRQQFFQSSPLFPLVHMLSNGSLQQQAAASGAIQAVVPRALGEAALPLDLSEAPILHHLVNILQRAPRPMQCAAAGALCNLALGLREAEVLVTGSRAVKALVDLLSDPQPDGQYSAAATLVNLSLSRPDVLPLILDCGALDLLMPMLVAKSWYCRIVSADLLLRLCLSPAFTRQTFHNADFIMPLVELLCLQQSPADIPMAQVLSLAHLAYERSQEVIVMKGYKFHRAKLVAALAMGQLCYSFPEQLLRGPALFIPILQEIRNLLTSPLQIFGATGAALLADLCQSSPEFAAIALQEQMSEDVNTLLKSTLNLNSPKEGTDVLQKLLARCAARALLVLCQHKTAVSDTINGQGLLKLLLSASRVEANDSWLPLECALLLQILSSRSSKLRIAEMVPVSGVNGAPAPDMSILQNQSACSLIVDGLSALQAGGYAVTAKPSANLYILLQIPFEVLVPAETLQNGRASTRGGSVTDERLRESDLRRQERQARARQAALSASMDAPILETWNDQQ